MPETNHAAWCRRMFDSLNENAVWGVPDSGLIFQRQGNTLVLIDMMPHAPELPLSATERRERQERMYAETVQEFGKAGILVRMKGTCSHCGGLTEHMIGCPEMDKP